MVTLLLKIKLIQVCPYTLNLSILHRFPNHVPPNFSIIYYIHLNDSTSAIFVFYSNFPSSEQDQGDGTRHFPRGGITNNVPTFLPKLLIEFHNYGF